ncbi:MAG: alginate lyase family protein, partial [Bryobacteraceae bacterium]
ASALEVAFRALSWIWVYHLLGDALPETTRRRLAAALYRHGLHLASNLSVYFSPNTHLLGEAVALHALGALFPEFPAAAHWEQTGADLVRAQMEAQVRDDGAHFEQSTYYHVYAVDLFLLHAVLAETSAAYRTKLARMAEYLWALLGPEGEIPLLGDDDGGRVFHPYGERRRFGRATLAACAVFFNRTDWPCEPADAAEIAAWWLGPRALAQPAPWKPRSVSELFPDSGVAVMTDGCTHIVIDTLGFGAAGAGHSHAHALSLVCRRGPREILIDPGTYTYVVSAEWLDRFRGTAAHNTVRVEEADQAEPLGSFRWNRKPVVSRGEWISNANFDYLSAACSYAGYTHWRRVLWLKPDLLLVVDDVEGSGERTLEQYWHTGQPVELLTPHSVAIGTE